MENHIICCDWGTSSLRVRWVDRTSRKTLREVKSDLGIARVYDESRKDSWNSAYARIRTYLQALEPALNALNIPAETPYKSLPLIISGMASSSIGMKELPYATTPFDLDGTNAVVEMMAAEPTIQRDVLLISGLRTADDVMRGEEVQLIGMQADIQSIADGEDVLVILPGTHSKHVVVKENRITNFDTFFTGDLFALLSRQGLLKESVAFPENSPTAEDWPNYLKGVEYSGRMEMLEALFKVRTNVLLQKMTRSDNFYFLSGLLIGYELRSIRRHTVSQVIVSCQKALYDYYKFAAGNLDLDKDFHFTPPGQVDQFTVNGQIRVFEQYHSGQK